MRLASDARGAHAGSVQIADMKKHLEQPRSAGRAKQRLQDIDRTIPDAAWSVLRWVVASCTAHLEELTSDEEQVKNIGASRLPSLLLVCRRD